MPAGTPHSESSAIAQSWPPLPFSAWRATYETLHMWTQIVGKVKLELCPFLNELWEVALHLTARGLTTGTIPSPTGVFEVSFDFIDHNLYILTSDGRTKALPLMPRSVADFYAEFMAAIRALGIAVTITTKPDEVADRIPFDEDRVHASYDADQVRRWWHIVMQVSKLFEAYRSPFVGKSSPVLFYWGSFDLNQTRFSGRPAAPPSGLPRFMRLAEDQENVSAGFWPGNEKLGGPAFYSYTAPAPPDLKTASIRPSAAHYDPDFGEFLLPYEEVRRAGTPEAMILEFLQSTYEVGATLAHWDRSVLERTVPAVSKHAKRSL